MENTEMKSRGHPITYKLSYHNQKKEGERKKREKE